MAMVAPEVMQKAITSAREALQHAAMHEQKGLPASASTILTIEMVKISAALKHFTGMQSRNSRILEDVLEKCRARENHCRASARRQMQTYGLLYKQGHFVKNWQTRLFILSGGQLKYYVPGDTEAKGTIMLHQIKTVQAVTVRQNGFKIETQGKVYYCQAPDEMSLQAWMAALRPLKVGFLMKQGQEVQSWKKRWCMLWRTQLAYFENHADTKDRKGYILLRDTIPDRVFAVDRSVFGHDNIFQVETRERTFFMQAISGDDMQEWLDHINTAVASRGPAEDAMQDAEMNQFAGGSSTEHGLDGAQGSYHLAGGGSSRADDFPGSPAEGTPRGDPGAPVYDDGINENIPQQEVVSASMQMAQANVSQDMASITAMQEEIAKKKLALDDREHDLRHREAVLQNKLDQLEAQGHRIDFTPTASAQAPAPAPMEYHAEAPVHEAPAQPQHKAAPDPEPAPVQMQPRADQKQYTFIVTSDDLFADQRKRSVFAATLQELEDNLAQALEVGVGVYVLVHDADFDEYCLPDSIGEVPQTGRVKVKQRS